MIIVYDFDGTLTPYTMPQYKVIKDLGYDDEKYIEKMNQIEADSVDAKDEASYPLYYLTYKTILDENNIPFNEKNACIGVNEITYNNGVEEFLKRNEAVNTGIKHYIVSSGLEVYLDHTKIRKYVDGIYGVTFKKDNEGNFFKVDFMLSASKKVDAIKDIIKKNYYGESIIYFGDGLTDTNAFEYVKRIGGKCVFINTASNAKKIFKSLKKAGIVDIAFEPDFTEKSKIQKFIDNELKNEKKKNKIK